MAIGRLDGLGDIANLGLTLTEAKQLLVRVQQQVVAAQADLDPCRKGLRCAHGETPCAARLPDQFSPRSYRSMSFPSQSERSFGL
jgi:hypothetical protein